MKDNIFESVRKLGCLLGMSMPESNDEILSANIFNSMARAIKRSWTESNSTIISLEEQVVELENRLDNLLKDFEHLKKTVSFSELSIDELYSRNLMGSNAKQAKELLMEIKNKKKDF